MADFHTTERQEWLKEIKKQQQTDSAWWWVIGVSLFATFAWLAGAVGPWVFGG